MLINLSNHPYKKWSDVQKAKATELFGAVTDIPFPAVDPAASTAEVVILANEYFNKIVNIFGTKADETLKNAVHIQGEFTFVCNLVTLLKKSKINCVASTSDRNVESFENGKKTINFTFVQFREY